ncbi:TPA: hypothetical protein ACH3X1_012103 [Trebouxia sp. C0004]
MAPVCQGDESFGQHVEVLLQSRVNAEVGVLIGRPGNRDIFLLLLPTPHEGNTAPVELQSVTDSSSKKKKKAQPDAQVHLAVDSITEHAAQVAAMLPGGLSVMGLYLYGPEAAFSNATSQLCKALDGMVAASSTTADKLLFISSQSRNFLCKHRAAGAPSSATLPVCEFKLVPSLSGFSIMTCRHCVSMILPILDKMQALSTNVESLIAAECQRITNGIGTTQGSMASSSTTVGDLQQPLQVELLCPPSCCDTTQAADVKEASVSGRVVLEGVLHGRAMVHKKDMLSTAVDLLKADLVSSLQTRLDILMAEAEEVSESNEAGGARHAILQSTSESSTYISLRLPTRVFFPVQDTLSFCDYLASGESMTDATCRLQPLLGKQANLSQMQNPEGTAGMMYSTKQMQVWTACPVPCNNQSWLPCNLSTAVLSSTVIAFSAAAVAFYSQS